jgi:hypothetical protein
MAEKLSYEEFVKKYIMEVGGDEIKSILSEVENSELDIFEQVFEMVCQEYYKEYLNGTLDYLDKNEDLDNLKDNENLK